MVLKVDKYPLNLHLYKYKLWFQFILYDNIKENFDLSVYKIIKAL